MDSNPRPVSAAPTRYTARLTDASHGGGAVWLRRLGRGAAVCYPLLVYYGLTHWPARFVALACAAFFLGLVALHGGGRHVVCGSAFLSATLVLLAGVAFVLHAHRLVLVFPVVINLVLLAAFWGSLRTGVPLVERFARLRSGELDPREIRYCRGVTVTWCVFFAANGVAAGLLALFAPLHWWAAYTGILSYVLMATLFSVEYVVRICRFPKARPLRWQLPPGS